MYLDTDLPNVKRGNVRGKLEAAIREATRRLDDAKAEGQIGLYENAHGHGFAGYVIRSNGETWFEPAEGKS